MAKQPYILTSFLCLQICNAFPPTNVNILLSNFVLDGKNDCKLGDINIDAIKLFKAHQCPEHIKAFSENYFEQREILPCYGVYDALYNLCEFPVNKFDFKVPLAFNNSKHFCIEAKRVYKNLNFTYKGSAIKKWSGALRKTMLDEKHCDNLCIMDDNVNEHCLAMLTFANEYLRLKDKLRSDDSPKLVASQEETKAMPLNSSSIPASGLSQNVSSKTDLTKKVENVTITNEMKKPETADNTVQISDGKTKNKENVNSDNKTMSQNVESKGASVLDKTKSSGAENENAIKNLITLDVKPSVDDKNVVSDIPVTDSVIQKIPPNDGISVLDGAVEDAEQTMIPQDDIHGGLAVENEEGILPGDVREKGFDVSSPFSILLNIHHTIRTPLASSHEESEKPNEEEKTAMLDTDQHAIWPGSGFNPIRDSLAESEDSYSFTYIVTTLTFLCAVYLLFHFRNKLLALALEGRKGRNSRGRGRPSSANYSKLHSNLEEAIASNITTPSATHVLY